MNTQFDFSKISYEYIRHESSLPFKIFFTSIGYRGFHWHKDFEMILVLKGQVNYITKENSMPLVGGDLYLSNPYELHGLVQGEEGNLLLVLQIDPDMANSYQQNLSGIRFRLPASGNLYSEDYRRLSRSISVIMEQVYYKSPGFDYLCMAEVNTIIATLVKSYIHTRITQNENKSALLERIRVILGYMNDNHKWPISLAELAEKLNLSPFYVSHLIKKFTGVSFQENLGMIRTHYAIRLMMNSDENLMDIAMEAGFSDIRYFNKYFKKLFFITPSELRKKNNWKSILLNAADLNESNISQLIPELDPYLKSIHTR